MCFGVGLSASGWVCQLRGGLECFGVGLSALRWVCQLRGGLECFGVGLSTSRWVCLRGRHCLNFRLKFDPSAQV